MNIRSTCHLALTDNHSAAGRVAVFLARLGPRGGSLAELAQFGGLIWPTSGRTGTLIRASPERRGLVGLESESGVI